MAPRQHLAWFHDNVSWFEALPSADLGSNVANCPGWTIEDVVNHLSFGLGLGYPVALSKPPETAARDAFVGIPWPNEVPAGQAAVTAFSVNMGSCLQAFWATDPTTPCWTYAGPGVAGFWFRRAAVETALHRLDVEDALPAPRSPLPDDRVADAISETLEFALPFAAAMTSAPDGQLTVHSPELDLSIELGTGDRQATIVGGGEDLLCALWGRSPERVEVIGDPRVADGWLSRIELAFAGR